MKIKIAFLVVTLALSMASVLKAQDFFSNPGDMLSQAHEAYLAGDFKTMALDLHQVLVQNSGDLLAKENALALLKSAYSVANGRPIPLDWHLPDEIKAMKVGVKYSFREGGQYTFRVYGSTIHEKSIVQLQVIQFPDHVILDKEGKIGEWSDQSQIDSLAHIYELQTEKSRLPVAPGLYLLNLTLADGTQTKGWFILEEDLNSTEVPAVDTPTAGQVFTTGNPTFTWQNFISPEYRPFEKRSLWIGVSRYEAPNYNWDEVWGHFEIPPVSEQVTIDSHGDPGSLAKLNQGNYLFFIDYHEQKKFGDLDMTRDSIAFRTFKIAQ